MQMRRNHPPPCQDRVHLAPEAGGVPVGGTVRPMPGSPDGGPGGVGRVRMGQPSGRRPVVTLPRCRPWRRRGRRVQRRARAARSAGGPVAAVRALHNHQPLGPQDTPARRQRTWSVIGWGNLVPSPRAAALACRAPHGGAQSGGPRPRALRREVHRLPRRRLLSTCSAGLKPRLRAKRARPSTTSARRARALAPRSLEGASTGWRWRAACTPCWKAAAWVAGWAGLLRTPCNEEAAFAHAPHADSCRDCGVHHVGPGTICAPGAVPGPGRDGEPHGIRRPGAPEPRPPPGV